MRIWIRRFGIAAALLALALVGIGCAGPSATPYEQGVDRYRFKFALSRVTGETGTCTASASVKDLMTDRGMSIPIFTAPWGVETTASASDSAYGARLDVTVTIGSSGQSGEFEATVHRGELLVASRKASLPVAIVKSPIKAVPR